MSQTQVLNSQLIDLLSSTFQKKRDTMFAWGKAVSSFLCLPGLVGFWPGVVANRTSGNPAIIDYGHLQAHLNRNGSYVGEQFGLTPGVRFASATNDVGNTADSAPFDITGTEAYQASYMRGMTIGGWFVNTFNPGAFAVYTGKSATGLTCNYRIQRALTSGNTEFVVNDGSGSLRVATNSTTVPVASQWVFIVGRFVPSTAVDIWVNEELVRMTTTVGASLTTNSEPFTLGARSDGVGGYQDFWTGVASMVFVCGTDLSDPTIRSLYHQSRVLFGA